MAFEQLIEDYLAGPELLRAAVDGMSAEQLDARPVPGTWSTRQVVCHIADFEPVYADRIKRAIAEDEPTVFGGDPDRFAARLSYERRNVADELNLVEAVRRHLAPILQSLDEAGFQRTARHSVDGPVTVETLLRRITGHIPHHVRFIHDKRRALDLE